ncbi:MAG: Flp pilus assembly complex ATPase component TadA [Oscillospiraceae bacterium]|nr:Flp pilus assembly complex ATPase component TadA [Oscillospiraceae bacterium]
MNSQSVIKFFPAVIREVFSLSDKSLWEDTAEIRLKINFPVILRGKNGEKYLYRNGKTGTDKEMAVICTANDMEYIFCSVCDDSVHSYARELKEGFITVSGGHRVGLCGTAVINEKGMKTIKNISSINFRIAHEIKGCSDLFFNLFSKEFPCGILIAGAPGSGKTTFLRDLCRNFSKEYRVSVIDERSEIAAVSMCVPQNDIGEKCDVFDGYPRKEGINTALRVMSPEIIVCDEIGSDDDIKAITNSANTGVSVIATVHAGNKEELYMRKNIMKLIGLDIFRLVVFLENGERTGMIREVVHCKDKKYGI